MSLITPELWHTYLGDIPMPDGCTYWQFVAAREVLWLQEDLDASTEYARRLRILANTPSYAAHRADLDDLLENEFERLKNV